MIRMAHQLKPWVRYNDAGMLIPGSVIWRKHQPRWGHWKSLAGNICCDPGTSMTGLAATADGRAPEEDEEVAESSARSETAKTVKNGNGKKKSS